MESFNWIVLGDFIETLTDYHANGSYKILKKNIELKRSPDYAIMIRTLNFERPDFENDLIYLDEKEYNYLKKTKVYPNDILMNKIANPGSVYLMPNINMPVSLAMNLFLIRFNREVNQVFMFYLMKTNESYIKKFANGTTTLTITKDSVKGLNFKVPPKSTQDNIAKTLSDIDKKIELNNKINAELESMAKLIYDYWFVQFDFPDANDKPYKSSGGKMVYNEALKREIPEGWEVRDLGDLIKVERGISYKSSEITENGTPMINLNSFSLTGKYKSAGLKYFSGTYRQNKVVAAGDLVIAITDVTRNADIIGKAFTIPALFGKDILISCDVAKIVPSKLINNQFLEPLFNSRHYHNYIKHFASGTLVLHLNLDGLMWCKIPLPPKKLLDRYSEFRQNIDRKITLSIKENQKLSELRDWLLPMLMNGQVTVKDSYNQRKQRKLKHGSSIF